MSSSNNKLSAKEREILEKQKKLASRINPNAKPPPPPGAPKAAASKATTLVSFGKKTSGGVKNSSSAPPVAKTTGTTTTGATAPPPPKPKPTQKRPTLKRKGIAARPPTTEPPAKRPSLSAADSGIKVERKEKKVAPGSLAELVRNVTTTDMAAAADAMLPTIQADDFWKYIREWDFCTQFGKAIGPNSNDAGAQSSRKPLPNIFLNVKQYIALWAPLCVAECKAQIIQEAGTKMTAPFPVKVTKGASFLRQDGRGNFNNKAIVDFTNNFEEETASYVTLVPEQRGAGNKMNFMVHDICLLLTADRRDLLKLLRTGRAVLPSEETSWDMAALVGHVENPRKGVQGLTLKVSKRKWAKMRNSNLMYLVHLGCNITALREFTALCRIDMLPLQKFLLGQHLERGKPRKLSRNQSTQQLLNEMGGKVALGEGFSKYAQSKFNTSQLTAIAASAAEYGDGGFTLIKGPPGTGKTTTLVAVLNSLHIRQYNKYYDEVKRIATETRGGRQHALEMARRSKPRLLVCAPSNAAVDNIILKIMEDGFIDGQGNRYNPSIIRVGVGQSSAVKAVALETKVDSILSDHLDAGRLESSINGYRVELQRVTQDIGNLRRKMQVMKQACDWPLSKDWEIRVDDENADAPERAYFVNHKDKLTTYEVPPPPEPDEQQFPVSSMPEYRSYVGRTVKLVESYFSIKSHLDRCTIVQGGLQQGANNMDVRMNLELDVLNSVHIVMTTLGSAGNRTLEGTEKFEVVVVDEAAQSVEPATLSALQLGSRHCVLVGDPQQLPATIFNVSGRNSKYDRSLFQRLEEAGQPVYMLNEQYRMHPEISHFPRHIFYGGNLRDGVNVRNPKYGNPLVETVRRSVAIFRPFTVLNLDSKEEKTGTSLSNPAEARLAVYLVEQLKTFSRGLSTESRIAVITPYAQQSRLLRQIFADSLGPEFEKFIEVNTVDAFQGREANIVIFSAVRASDSKGIGFLSDVRRMNVALTRAKHFLFVIARVSSIVQNPYWKDLVNHARETNAVVHVPVTRNRNILDFGMISSWKTELPDPNVKPSGALSLPAPTSMDPRRRAVNGGENRRTKPPMDPRRVGGSPAPPPPPPPPPPRHAFPPTALSKASDPRQKPRDPRVATSASSDTCRPSDPRKRN